MIKFQQILSEIKYVSEITPEMISKLYYDFYENVELALKAHNILYSKGYRALHHNLLEWLENQNQKELEIIYKQLLDIKNESR